MTSRSLDTATTACPTICMSSSKTLMQDVTPVGFSMGGGEVARYLSRYGADRVHSVVFASAVTPYMLHTGGNPDGPMTMQYAAKAAASLIDNVDAFYEQQMTEFFSVNGELIATDAQRAQALALCKQSAQEASLACLVAWGSTDFRDDLASVSLPALVIHGDGDASVPFEGSATRTHARSRTASCARSATARTVATSGTPKSSTRHCSTFSRRDHLHTPMRFGPFRCSGSQGQLGAQCLGRSPKHMADERSYKTEDDVEGEHHQTEARDGREGAGSYVGRTAADDAIDAGETGAEARSKDTP